MAEKQILMPKMGESITEGTILNWLVQEGDFFEEGDIIVEVATDKVDNEVPAPASGILKKHLFFQQFEWLEKCDEVTRKVGDVIMMSVLFPLRGSIPASNLSILHIYLVSNLRVPKSGGI